MPSFQSPVPISGRPCAPSARLMSMRARAMLVQAGVGIRRGWPEKRFVLPGLEQRRLRGMAGACRGCGCPLWRRCSGRRRRAARGGRRSCACARPVPLGGSHQCCTSPSTNCRAAARSKCARAIVGTRHADAPSRPATGRENHRRRWPGNRPCAPTPGSPASGTAASVEQQVHRPVGRAHLHGAEHVVPVADRGCRTCVEVGLAVTSDQCRALPPRRWHRPTATRLRFRHRQRNSIWVCNAAQGSRPAPTRPDSGAPPRNAAGASTAPWRPRNSERSAGHAKPAARADPRRRRVRRTRRRQALRANSAPVSASSRVTTNGAGWVPFAPSAHCTKAVTDSLRARAGAVAQAQARELDADRRPARIAAVPARCHVPGGGSGCSPGRGALRKSPAWRAIGSAVAVHTSPLVLVAHIQHFLRRIDDRIVGPRRQRIALAVRATTHSRRRPRWW